MRRQECEHDNAPPSISVVIPTLNSEACIRQCLDSIKIQRYTAPVEVIVADGGSTDGTVEVARGYGCIVVENPAKTGEAGKARGSKEATGDVVALIDSDNILPCEDWFERMTSPFVDSNIAGSEPLRFEYRPRDPILTRYCALIGMNDPLCHFLKNYDRVNTITGRWTGLDIHTEDRGDYLEVHLEKGKLPTMGANGFLVRRELLELLDTGDYLFDVDLMNDLVERGYRDFAKVKIGIVHIYGRGLSTFARKQLRRVRDYRYYKSLGMRSYPWDHQKKLAILKFCLYCVLLVPLLMQSITGYRKRPDSAWLLHAPACIITLAVYGWGYAEATFRAREQERARWRQ